MPWIDRHAEDLIERSEPAEALAWLRSAAGLTERQAGTLDLYLHHWALVTLQRQGDPEGVLELLDLCQVAQVKAPRGTAGDQLRLRWQTFEDLLEGKRLTLRAAETALPTPLRHEDRIRQFIQAQPQQRATQSALAAHLSLSAGRVSQILGVLEGRSHITRQRQGQENWVRWTAKDDAQPKPVTTPGPAQHLGALVFARAA